MATHEILYSPLASQLSALRAKEGVSIKDFAQKLGIAKSTLQLILKGRGTSWPTMNVIAKNLDIPLIQLLFPEYASFLTSDVALLGPIDLGTVPSELKELCALINQLSQCLEKIKADTQSRPTETQLSNIKQLLQLALKMLTEE